jgi:hypothetical protein
MTARLNPPGKAGCCRRPGRLVPSSAGDMTTDTQAQGRSHDVLVWGRHRISHDGTDVDDEVEELVRRHAPALIVLPEGRPDDREPYPEGHSDYHPRTVELFLSEARLLRRATTAAVRTIYVFLMVAAPAVIVLAIVGRVHTGPLSLELAMFGAVLLAAGLALLVAVVRSSRVPAGEQPALAEALAADLDQGRVAFVLTVAPGWSIRGASARLAWSAYCETVANRGTEFPHTAYLRVIRDSGMAELALQFWFFFAYNHWANEHEADWESATLFFGSRERGSRRPVAIALSNHLGCLWRAWGDVTTFDMEAEEHPVAYVARGSHALYFEPKSTGFDPVLARQIPTPLIALRLAVTRRTTLELKRDFVPNVWFAKHGPSPRSAIPYEIQPLPATLDALNPSSVAHPWAKFWWLRYQGGWSRSRPISGPAWQAGRWYRPFEWVSNEGQADAHWEDVFTRGRNSITTPD